MNAITGQGEVALWRAVIQQAMSDAMPRARMHNGRPVLSLERRREMGNARRWLADARKDFRMVCDHALLEPEAVAASARTAIAAFDGALPKHAPTREPCAKPAGRREQKTLPTAHDRKRPCGAHVMIVVSTTVFSVLFGLIAHAYAFADMTCPAGW